MWNQVFTVTTSGETHRLKSAWEWESGHKVPFVDYHTACGLDGTVQGRVDDSTTLGNPARLLMKMACTPCWYGNRHTGYSTYREDRQGRDLPVEVGKPTPADNLRALAESYECTIGPDSAHDWINPHKGQDCDSGGCMWCQGGLTVCSRCGSFEGATTTHCPGEEMYQGYGEAVYAGHVDYRDGKWWRVGSPWTPSRGWDLATGEYL